jgi:hypothetical protein
MWIEVHDSARDHPKMLKVARDLGVAKVQVLGHVVSLWLWTLRMAPDGDLGSFDHDDVAIAAEWDGDAETFIAAMLKRELLDQGEHGLVIHDWMDFAGSLKAAQRARDYRARKRDNAELSHTVTSQSRDGNVSVTSQYGDITLTDQTGPDRPELTRPNEQKDSSADAEDLPFSEDAVLVHPEPDPVHQVWEFYRAAIKDYNERNNGSAPKLPEPNQKIGGPRRAKVAARLKTCTVGQIFEAITGILKCPFHTGRDPKTNGTTYVRLDKDICKDDGAVETWASYEGPGAAPARTKNEQITFDTVQRSLRDGPPDWVR